jgi:hypothetical protein
MERPRRHLRLTLNDGQVGTYRGGGMVRAISYWRIALSGMPYRSAKPSWVRPRRVRRRLILRPMWGTVRRGPVSPARREALPRDDVRPGQQLARDPSAELLFGATTGSQPNSRPVFRRPNEFDACGLECGLDVHQARCAAPRESFKRLIPLYCSSADARFLSQLLNRPPKGGSR